MYRKAQILTCSRKFMSSYSTYKSAIGGFITTGRIPCINVEFVFFSCNNLCWWFEKFYTYISYSYHFYQARVRCDMKYDLKFENKKVFFKNKIHAHNKISIFIEDSFMCKRNKVYWKKLFSCLCLCQFTFI